jgi:polysaccharide biosynthesis transport protein
MNFNQFLRIIRARWILAASIVLVSILGTLIVSMVLPKTYTASASVMADIRPDPVAAYVAPSALSLTFLATQLDIIKSPSVSQRVVRAMRLTESPEMRERWAKATDKQGDYEAWLGELIGKGLDVKPSRESTVIEITYEGATPAFATALANAYAKAYLETTVQVKVDPARNYASFFEERGKQARERVEQARSKLTAAQREKGIIVTDERIDGETSRLAELATQVSALKSMSAEALNRSSQAKASPDQTREVLNNAVISSLKADMARQEARLQEMTERYGDAHPLVMETKANIQSLKERVRSETVRVTGSARIDDSVARSREAEAVARYEEQRRKVLALKDARAELQVLEREVDSAQRLYDTIQDRMSQTSLESHTTQSGIYLLSPATEPSSATSPRIVLNVIVAAVLGVLLAIMVVMTFELADRRVRGAFDITNILELPVIGILPPPTAKLSGGNRRVGFLGKSSSSTSVVSVSAQQ